MAKAAFTPGRLTTERLNTVVLNACAEQLCSHLRAHARAKVSQSCMIVRKSENMNQSRRSESSRSQ